MQFTKENSLYNNTPASWTASNISVNGGATLGLNVGGTGEFTASDVATLSALGTTTGGLRNGSILALDTTNATGGVFALTSPITNTNSGANVINLNKIGVNTLQLAAGPNTYTGTTTVSKGTLQLTGNNSLTGNTVVTIANDATATFDLNGFNTTIGGLTGGGTTGGKVSLGTGNLTVVTPTNSTYAGSFTSTGGGLNFNLGSLGSNAVTQTLTGGGSTGGNLTVTNGTRRAFAGECDYLGLGYDQHGDRAGQRQQWRADGWREYEPGFPVHHGWRRSGGCLQQLQWLQQHRYWH